MIARGRRRRRSTVRFRAVAVGSAVVAALLGSWLAVSLAVIATPRVDTPDRPDALLVLGPVHERMGLAHQLMDDGIAPVILVSVSIDRTTGIAYPEDFCNPSPTYRVECFVPDPFTTQGEAQRLSALAEARGWDEVAVMTETTHIPRARMLMERCTDVRVVMVEYPEAPSLQGWLESFAYQSGAWVKAMLTPGCYDSLPLLGQ